MFRLLMIKWYGMRRVLQFKTFPVLVCLNQSNDSKLSVLAKYLPKIASKNVISLSINFLIYPLFQFGCDKLYSLIKCAILVVP